jgi:hypothetical protein
MTNFFRLSRRNFPFAADASTAGSINDRSPPEWESENAFPEAF